MHPKQEVFGLHYGCNVMREKQNHTAMRKLSCFIFGLFIFVCANSQVVSDSMLYEMDLEQLLSVKVSIATKVALTSRESPGIISVITSDEIKAVGARDFMDVLNLVPGFSFGMDVQGAVGAGMRGNWGHEGKILLMIDGQEQNELFYSTTEFGNHYSVDQIKQVEIIRGPGSAVYGGYAELSVINVVTKTGAEMNGISFTGLYGQLNDDFGRQNLYLGFGKQFGELDVSAHAFIGRGNRSTEKTTDFSRNTFSMKGASELNPNYFNLGIKYKGFSVKFIADLYKTTQKDMFGYHFFDDKPAIPTDFISYFGEIKYEYKLTDKITLCPKFNYTNQATWITYKDEILPYLDTLSPYYYEDLDYMYNKKAVRSRASLALGYDMTENINFQAGLEGYMDVAEGQDDRSFFYDKNDSLVKSVNYSTISAFTQLLWQNPIVNVTAGLRFEDHSQTGSAIVPRLALTKVMNKLHLKLLASQAYRSPGIENINSNKDIEPELTTVLEAEVGYKLSEKMVLTGNVFNIHIEKPIVYYVDEAGDAYKNFDKTGTRGFELEYKFVDKKFNLHLNYSFYQVAKNKVNLYEVPGNANSLLGFPQHKLNMYAQLKLKNLSISPSIAWMGKRYSNYMADANDSLLVKEFDPAFNLNLFVRYENLLVKGLTLGAGVYDILDQNPPFLQPYLGGHAPYPGGGREILFKLEYFFGL